MSFLSFFFNDPATTEIYTLSLHDALPIYVRRHLVAVRDPRRCRRRPQRHGRLHGVAEQGPAREDRKSTRLNSSHPSISYAVFCLKKKIKKNNKQAIQIIT